MEDREALIRSALRDLEPDEQHWRHFGVLVLPPGSCSDAAVREYLERSPRPHPVPVEALSYTVRYIGGDKVVFIDFRRVDGLRRAVDDAFGVRRKGPRDGFFRA